MNTSKINYVIASWSGIKGSICRDKLTDVFPHPKLYLREHLKQLLTVKHTLSQITIMKPLPESSDKVYNKYYDISDLTGKFSCPVVVVECPNFALSYGQYLRAYDKYKTEFDHYIFIEDDYTAGCDHFDSILLNLYQHKFPLDIGYLCSWALKTKKDIEFHAALSNGMISGNSMKQLQNKFTHPLDQFAGLTHGDVQVRFSDMMLESRIPIKDYSNEYLTPYYKGVHKRLIDCSRDPLNNKIAVFIPLQLLNKMTRLATLPKHRLA
jgi:hypothetical protein